MTQQKDDKKEYNFGGIKEFNLEQIESEVLNDSVYLDVFAGSDSVFKKDLKSVESCLEKLETLDAVNYLYKTDEFPKHAFPKTRQIGFIAQAVEKVFPELVMKTPEGHLMVNYANLTPVLTEGVKELSSQVKRQEQEIQELKNLVNQLLQTKTQSEEEQKDQARS